jgi:hypothetical protein
MQITFRLVWLFLPFHQFVCLLAIVYAVAVACNFNLKLFVIRLVLKLFVIRLVLKSIRGCRYILHCVVPVTNQLKNTFTFETCIFTVRLLHLSTDSLFCVKYFDVIHQYSTVAAVVWTCICRQTRVTVGCRVTCRQILWLVGQNIQLWTGQWSIVYSHFIYLPIVCCARKENLDRNRSGDVLTLGFALLLKGLNCIG